MRTDPIQQFAAAFVGDPEDARRVLYGSKVDVPRFAKDWCMVMGMSMLVDLDVLLNGGYSRDGRFANGVTLLQPEGALNLGGKVSAPPRENRSIAKKYCGRLRNWPTPQFNRSRACYCVSSNGAETHNPCSAEGLATRSHRGAPAPSEAEEPTTPLQQRWVKVRL